MIVQSAVNIKDISQFNQLSRFLKIVSDERRRRVASYRFSVDKIRCLIAELLVRHLLAEHFGVNPTSLLIRYSRYGKPYLENSNIHFNISHSGDWVVCAMGDSEIGVDIEVMKQIDFHAVYHYFSNTEIERLDAVDLVTNPDAFYQIWTLKESYVKYLGLGLQCPFSNFSIMVESNDKIKVAHDGHTNTVSFFSTKIDEGHWYALCMDETEQVAPIKMFSAQVLCNSFHV